jgi:hypothetical protein
MKTSQCENCKKRYKVLENSLCYFCFQNKYGDVPKTGCYKMGKKEK